MASNINYKAVYELQSLDLSPLESIRGKHEQKAREVADKEFATVKAAVEKYVGHDNLYFSNVCCVAKGIAHHVYVGAIGRDYDKHGVGKYRCLFCECDDFKE